MKESLGDLRQPQLSKKNSSPLAENYFPTQSQLFPDQKVSSSIAASKSSKK